MTDLTDLTDFKRLVYEPETQALLRKIERLEKDNRDLQAANDRLRAENQKLRRVVTA